MASRAEFVQYIAEQCSGTGILPCVRCLGIMEFILTEKCLDSFVMIDYLLK